MVILNKRELRGQIIEKRSILSKDIIANSSKKIIDQIRKDHNYQSAKVVGIYLPVNNEIDLRELLTDDKTFASPKIINNELYFSVITKDSPYIYGKFNILEPKDLIYIEQIDYLLTPAVAIYNNFRLGFGGGYYDKYLSKLRPKFVVGVIYEFQEQQFETDNYDQQLDYYFKG